jgi:hypothetical protein
LLEYPALGKPLLQIGYEMSLASCTSISSYSATIISNSFRRTNGTYIGFSKRCRAFHACVVASWGLPIEKLPNVQMLSGSEVRLIWFDGNRDVACKNWMRKTGKPDAEFRRQVATIDAGIAEIRRVVSRWMD